MKFSVFFVLLCVLFLNNIYSQEFDYYVALLPIDDDHINNQIEKLNLPVLYMDEDELVTIINSESLETLKHRKINYLILDDYSSGDKFFIISSKVDEDIANKFQGQSIIYKQFNSVLVKNTSLNPEQAIQLGVSVTECNLNNNFKNLRRIWRPELITLNDSTITKITSSVDPDSVRFFIQSLQDFQTRFLFANTRDSVALWIKNQFLQMGFTDVAIDSFQYQGTWQKNVVATLTGIYEPEVYNIVGGHHDSYSSDDPMIFAPGADDNASGTAAVLEIARVLMANNYQSESTIKFITFAAEEYGLWGSKDFAEKALIAGMNIKIMINHDMISHTYYPANQSDVDINRYSGYDYLRDLAFYCIENYSVLDPSNGSLNSSGSDSYSFWERGFPSVYFEETNFSPHYHSPADTIGNYNMEYCAEVIKSSCATLLLNIVMPTMVQNYELIDAGTGNSLLLMWSPNNSPDFDSYKIHLGSESGVYDTVFTTLDTVYNVKNLIEGNLYYVGISVLDQDGYESLKLERSATPLEIPLAPKEFTATPSWHQVDLSWRQNKEYDLCGYNIYRSDTEGQLGEKVNQSAYQDTVYFDNTASSGIYYYYTVKAVDSLLNESLNNTTLRSRIVTLDHGILIVDETADGDGTPMNPTDEEVDDFYDDLLVHFKSEQYDMIQETEISLADLGAFSTVIWHGNDVSDMNAPYNYKGEIIKYLNYGGNFLYAGIRPVRAFEQKFGNPVAFGNGDFIHDYLKIDTAYYTSVTLFSGALSLESGYNSIFVDSSKTLPDNEYHLKFIEGISSYSEGVKIFSYDSNFDSTSPQGSFKSKPVGVEYIGNDFKTITFSFPLYYLNKESAKELVEFILINKFDEPMPVEDNLQNIPTKYALEQNYPNPFNPSTKIEFQIPASGLVHLKVYDILGREVATLLNEELQPGNYKIDFDASDFASGIYFYTMNAGSFVSTKKMILVK